MVVWAPPLLLSVAFHPKFHLSKQTSLMSPLIFPFVCSHGFHPWKLWSLPQTLPSEASMLIYNNSVRSITFLIVAAILNQVATFSCFCAVPCNPPVNFCHCSNTMNKRYLLGEVALLMEELLIARTHCFTAATVVLWIGGAWLKQTVWALYYQYYDPLLEGSWYMFYRIWYEWS